MRYSRGSRANTRREDRRCLLFLHLTIVAGVPRPRCESRMSPDRDGSGEKKKRGGRSGATREQRIRVLRARASAGHPDIEINSHSGMAVTSMEVDGLCKKEGNVYEKTLLFSEMYTGCAARKSKKTFKMYSRVRSSVCWLSR